MTCHHTMLLQKKKETIQNKQLNNCGCTRQFPDVTRSTQRKMSLQGQKLKARVCLTTSKGKSACGSSCVEKEKKRGWERSSTTAFLTSAHLTNCCVRWAGLLDCRYWKVTQIGAHGAPNSNIGIGCACGVFRCSSMI